MTLPKLSVLWVLATTWLAFYAFARVPGVVPAMETADPPPLSLSAFHWAENLTFDAYGNLYVSDSEVGEIVRIFWNGSEWISELFFNDCRSALGLASDDQYLYANITTPAGLFQLIRLRIDAVSPTSEVIATLPKALNGLERDRDGSLYATTEGGFIPGEGEVYRIATSGEWDVFVANLWAADGIAIDQDQRIMYVTQVVNSRVPVIQMTDQVTLRTLNIPRFAGCLLDDIDLDPSGLFLYGACFGRGEILKIPVDGGVPTVVTSGLDAPTSVLFGQGRDFQNSSLYVTEGGGFLDTDTEQRVLEIPEVL